MNTIKKRALTSIAVCFMACLMFSMPVLAASNSFSKTTVKLNAIDGGVSQIAKVSSGSVLGTNPKITQVKVYLNVASGTDPFDLYIESPEGTVIGFPASHLGSATFTASVNACQYCRSYSSNVYPAANLSFFSVC